MKIVLEGQHANSAAMLDGLRRGCRWFSFPEPFTVNETINLDDFHGDHNFLTLEGPGLARAPWLKGFKGGPLITATDLWHHNWTGVEFIDFERWDDMYPMVDLQQTDRSEFTNITFHGGHLGGRMGWPIDPNKPTRCSTSQFANLKIYRGVTGGLHIYNGVALDFTRPNVERNGRKVKPGDNLWTAEGARAAGLRWEGPHRDHESYINRGLGTIEDGYFEMAGEGGYWGLELENVRRVQVWKNRFFLAHVHLGALTQRCRVYQNDRGLGSEIIDDAPGRTNAVYDNAEVEEAGVR